MNIARPSDFVRILDSKGRAAGPSRKTLSTESSRYRCEHRTRAALGIAAGLTLLSFGSVHGQVIAENLPLFGSPEQSTGDDVILADDFTLASAETVGAIGFWLLNTADIDGSGGAPNNPNMIYLFEDDAGQPGTVIWSAPTASLPLPLVMNPVDVINVGWQYVEWDISGDCITLAAGTQYWVGLKGELIETLSGGGIAQSLHMGGPSYYISSNEGVEWLPSDFFGSDRNLGFQIKGGFIDCNSNGVADCFDISSGAVPDANADDIPDDCQDFATLGEGDTATLNPGRGSGLPTEDSLVEIENTTGPAGSMITVSEAPGPVPPGTGDFSGFTGTILSIDTDLADGDYQMRVSIPFDAADLGARNWWRVNLRYFDGARWRRAAVGNVGDTPGYPPGTKLGDRFPDSAAADITLASLSPDLGDYGVFWNTTTMQGFVWANVDHTTDFAAGIAACPADFIGAMEGPPDGVVGILDFLAVLAQWGCTGTCTADITGPMDGPPDGTVGILDFLKILSDWGPCG